MNTTKLIAFTRRWFFAPIVSLACHIVLYLACAGLLYLICARTIAVSSQLHFLPLWITFSLLLLVPSMAVCYGLFLLVIQLLLLVIDWGGKWLVSFLLRLPLGRHIVKAIDSTCDRILHWENQKDDAGQSRKLTDFDKKLLLVCGSVAMLNSVYILTYSFWREQLSSLHFFPVATGSILCTVLLASVWVISDKIDNLAKRIRGTKAPVATNT